MASTEARSCDQARCEPSSPKFVLRLVSGLIVLAILCGAGLLWYALNAGDLMETASSPDGSWSMRSYIVIDGSDSDGAVMRITAQHGHGVTREVGVFDLGYDEVRFLGGSRASIGGQPVDLEKGPIRPW